MEDMTEYVTTQLNWAMTRMQDLIQDDKLDDAAAIGAEFIGWANESDMDVITASTKPS